MIKKMLQNGIVILFGSLLGLVIAEIAIRVLTPQICIAPFLTPDFHQAHVLEKNIDLIDDRFPFLNYHIQTNSLGLRMPEIENKERNISFHDPTEKMNQQLQNGHFDLMEFFIEDEHFNEKGNLLFYESVVDTVTNFMIQK